MLAMRFIVMVLGLILPSAAAMAGPPRVMEKAVPGGFKITIVDFVGRDETEAQALIAPKVRQLCGQLTPRWGRFTLKAMMPPTGKTIKPARFEQEISCITPSAEQVAGTTGPFAATEADENAVRLAALKFMHLRDIGEGEASFAMLSPSMQDTTDRVGWINESTKRPATIGSGVARRVVKITWYVDPPGVSSGVYAAADFDGHSSGLAIHCGYVALKRQASGDYLVVRLEEGRLPSDVAKPLTAEKMLEMRATLQCRD